MYSIAVICNYQFIRHAFSHEIISDRLWGKKITRK